MNTLDNQVLSYVCDAPSKTSFIDLQNHFRENRKVRRQDLKESVARLVKAGRLSYSFEFGNSYLGVAYDRPRQVSDHVILKPPMTSWQKAHGLAAIALQRGASFGCGEHPTTRLSIQLIDQLLHTPPWAGKKAAGRALDIGSGSGVLAIVAAKLGVGRVHAVDTDPCAVAETKANVCLNRLESQVSVFQGTFVPTGETYDLIIANLRMPTLISLTCLLNEAAEPTSAVVLSGLLTSESDLVSNAYGKIGFSVTQKRSEKRWCALRLVRGGF
jgi:ribosomal protein L11 methyltransferase